MSDISEVQRKLAITFHNLSLLKLALIHSSYTNENPGLSPVSNERLEFLGDAVLGLVIAQKLYQDFPESTEGELTRLRSALVRREKLAQLANEIGLGKYLQLGKGEEAGGGRDKPINLAGAFESVIAAIYLDRGLETARKFIIKLFGPDIYKQAHQGAGADYKSRLQEILQSQHQITPSYQLTNATGPDHDRQFTIEVRAGETVLGHGTGKSKKAAEMAAALSALEALGERVS